MIIGDVVSVLMLYLALLLSCLAVAAEAQLVNGNQTTHSNGADHGDIVTHIASSNGNIGSRRQLTGVSSENSDDINWLKSGARKLESLRRVNKSSHTLSLSRRSRHQFDSTVAGRKTAGLDQSDVSPAVQWSPFVDEVFHLLYVNDIHGRVGVDDESGGSLVGALCEVGRRNDLDGDGAVLLGGGDIFGASTGWITLMDEMPAIEFANLIGLKTSVLGNHEFDQGYDRLVERIAVDIRWTYLGANVYFADHSSTGELKEDSRRAFLPYEIVRTRRGNEIVVVGIAHENTPLLAQPDLVDRLNFRPADEELDRLLFGSDVVVSSAAVRVLIIHDGWRANEVPLDVVVNDTSPELQRSPFGRLMARYARYFDLVLSAHTHQRYNEIIRVISAGTTNTTGINNPAVKLIPVVQGGSNNEILVHAQLNFAARNHERPLRVNVDLIDLTEKAMSCQPGDTLKPIADQLEQKRTHFLNQIRDAPSVAILDQELTRCLRTSEECPLANLLADILKEYYFDQLAASDSPSSPVVALINQGGIRQTLPKGPIKKLDIYNMFPFSNKMVVLSPIPAPTLLKILATPRYQTNWLGISGAIVTTAPDAAIRLTPNASTYTVIASDYVISGWTPFLQNCTISKLVGPLLRDLIVAYFQRHSDSDPVIRIKMLNLTGRMYPPVEGISPN